MFSNINKPAFGTSTAAPSFGFGSTSTANQTPFGQSQLFGKTNTTGFGTSAPLFGSTSQQTTAPLFTNTAVPSFGAAPQQSGFGSTGLFGQQQNVSGGNGLFTGASTSTFGQQNKTAGFGFGAATTTPLFGQQQTQNFQPSAASGVFGGSAGFGGTTQMGTVIKFNPVTGTDTMQKSGITHSISTKHHCITCMKEYEAKSLEELRWEDYQCNRRGPQQQSGFGSTPFGAPASTAPSLFGQTETKPAFGQSTGFGPSSTGFGMTNQQAQPATLFGKSTTGFGATPTTNTFGFNTTPAFGTNAVKPFGAQPTQNVFGATPTSQPTAFGNNFFGQTNTQNTGGFFSKPAQTAFSSQQPVFTFGQQPSNQNTFFQQPKSTPGFGSFGQTNLTTSAGFGQPNNIFSQAPQNPFNAFQKPAQPTFGQPLQPGFGIGSQPATNNFFGGNKPLFGATTQSNFFTPPAGGFMMPQQQQPAPNLSAGFDLQQNQDFHTHVEQIYDPFPHREFLQDLALKPKGYDATNPQALKEILEQAPMPVTPIERNISKYRIMPKPRSTFMTTKYSLLDDVVDKTTTSNNFLLRNSTGKRLVLRRTQPRSDKELLEEYKRMSSAGNTTNQSLFRNIRELEETDKIGADFIKRSPDVHGPNRGMSPLTLRIKSAGPVFRSPDYKDRRSSIDLKTEGTQTSGPPEKPRKLKNKNLPALALNNDSDSDTKEEENLLERLPTNSELHPNSLENTPSRSFINISDLDLKLTAAAEEEGIIQSPKSSGKRGVKTVRFQDSEVSSSSDLESFVSTRYSTSTIDDNIVNTTNINVDSTDNTTVIVRNVSENITLSGENGTKSEKCSNPCGVKLERPEYYTVPPLNEIYKFKKENGSCIIKGFTIGRKGYGNIYFPDAVDISNLDLDEIIHFRYREITVYPDDEKKPPVGQGLNRKAQVTLDHVFPRNPLTREVLRDTDQIIASNFTQRLRLLAEKQNATFLDYRPETGSWVFTVEHFSKYQFTDADDEECAALLEKSRQEQEHNKLKEIEKQKEAEKKKSDEQQEIPEMIISKGLGGIMPSHTIDQPQDFSLTQGDSHSHLMHQYKDDGRNVVIMKSSFFDEESVSDVSSGEVGIIQHFSMPTASFGRSRSRPATVHGTKIKPVFKYYSLLNIRREVPLSHSVLVSRNYMDTAVFKGKSFKVGWSRGFSFTTTTSIIKHDPRIINKVRDDCPSNIIMHLDIGKLCGKPEAMNLEEHLRIVYKNSEVVIDNSGMPQFIIKEGLESLIEHQQTGNKSEKLHEDPTFAYYKEIWNLCLSLWGPEATSPTARRDLFSQWLEDTTFSNVYFDINSTMLGTKYIIKTLFEYLTCHQIYKAARLAMDRNLPRLSALISQSQEFIKTVIITQVEQWKESNALSFIHQDVIKLYMLLGGLPKIAGINVFEDLDWKRALAIHLWYMCPQGVSLIHAVEAYKHAFSVWGIAKEPIPQYCQSNPEPGVYDILYHIMLLFGSPKTSLDIILNTLTHTEDALDYRLSWILLQVFKALKLGTLAEQSADLLHIRFASQLEHIGLWHWSVFVLLFIRDKSAKMREIKSILERNLKLDRTSEDYIRTEDMLVRDFKIPAEWIHSILAEKAEFIERNVECLKHLVLAKDWRKANAIAVSHIIPELITSSQCDKLSKLLKELIPGKREIASWETKTGLVVDFLDVQERVELIKSNITEHDILDIGSSDQESEIIKIKSELMSQCRRIKLFPTNSPKQTLAVAEISRFLALLLHLIYCELQPCSPNNVNTVMAQITELTMPPDYKIVELKKYIREYLKLY